MEGKGQQVRVSKHFFHCFLRTQDLKDAFKCIGRNPSQEP